MRFDKETKSSFEIEHIQSNASRTENFITSLEHAEEKEFCNKEKLLELQNLSRKETDESIDS
jgi:hypothetical protein